MRAISNYPSATFIWRIIQSSFSFSSETIAQGPEGNLLIIKKNIINPNERIVIGVTAR